MKIGDLVVRSGWTGQDGYGLIINTGLDQFKKPAAHVVWLKDDEQTIEQLANLEIVCK